MHKQTNIPQHKRRKCQTLIMNAIYKEVEDERLVEGVCLGPPPILLAG